MIVGDAIHDENRKVNCPECDDETLQNKRLRPSGVRIDVCPNCQGAWFDADEMPEVLTVASQRLKPPSDARPSLRLCPKGCKRMRVFKYPQTDVLVDMCPECLGIWLDPGEFAEIREVRRQLEKSGKLDTDGSHHSLFGWISHAIKSLTDSH